MLGAGETKWVAMVGGWSQCKINAKTRNPWYRTLFSMSSLVLSLEIAGRALTWTGGAGASGPIATVLPSLVVTAFVYFLANSLLEDAERIRETAFIQSDIRQPGTGVGSARFADLSEFLECFGGLRHPAPGHFGERDRKKRWPGSGI